MNEIDLRRFDLNLLVVFEVLMIERNVTRAAERLGRTQSAVSHSLARLRQQLGDPLLLKGARRMEPTPFALKLLDEAQPIRAPTLPPHLPAGGARFRSGAVHRLAGGRAVGSARRLDRMDRAARGH